MKLPLGSGPHWRGRDLRWRGRAQREHVWEVGAMGGFWADVVRRVEWCLEVAQKKWALGEMDWWLWADNKTLGETEK